MNTALKSNLYHLPQRDNKVTKSGQQIKKELLLEKLVKVIRLKHYSKATERVYSSWVSAYIDFRIARQSKTEGAQAI